MRRKTFILFSKGEGVKRVQLEECVNYLLTTAQQMCIRDRYIIVKHLPVTIQMNIAAGFFKKNNTKLFLQIADGLA